MISIKGKKRLSLCLATLVLGVNLMCFSTVVFATPDSLNEIGGSQQTVETPVTPSTSNQTSTTTQNNTTATTPSTSQTQQSQATQPAQSNVSDSNQDSAAAVGEIFKQGGLTSESVEKSKKWVEPVAKVINLAMAVVLGIFSALLVLVSVLDMVYIGLPFTRPYLCPNAQQPQQGMGASPMMGGMTGYGRGGMMGMNGMSGMQQQQQSSGLAATIGQWISDDALNAVREAQATQQQGAGASPMMGSFGMQAQAQQPQPKGKSLILGYLKKRSFTLIMLGVCLVLFTCTVFTDLGTMIGVKLLSLLSGINM